MHITKWNLVIHKNLRKSVNYEEKKLSEMWDLYTVGFHTKSWKGWFPKIMKDLSMGLELILQLSIIYRILNDRT